MLLFMIDFVIMLVFMGNCFMSVLMFMHLPVVFMKMRMLDFRMVVYVFMGNNVHCFTYLLSYPNYTHLFGIRQAPATPTNPLGKI